MYNDEENLYHYSYRSGSERPNTVNEAPVIPVEPTPKKKKDGFFKKIGTKTAIFALCIGLLGGAGGAGIVLLAGGGQGSTSIQSSGRKTTAVDVKTVDGKTQMSAAEVYAATVNSVVSINCSATSTNVFGQSVESASSGSGFIITADGYIVTNHHVIEGASSVKVTLYNGDSYDASVVGSDEDYDIAVLKINATGLAAVTLGDSSGLNVGDTVLAVGNPLGELTFSMSQGIVSCCNRAINVDGTPFNMIQVDASINPGNSGGPLVNTYGEVVGIVSAKYSSYSNTSVEGLGFAIPINDVTAMITDIMENGQVTTKPYMAITAGTLTEEMASQYQLDLKEGVFVYSVNDGGAAQKAGLKMGDVITKLDDADITSMSDLSAAKKNHAAGDTVTLTIYRDGSYQTVQLTFDTAPASSETAQDNSAQNNQGSGSYDDWYNYFYGNRGNNGSSN
jgi:serine protease Do